VRRVREWLGARAALRRRCPTSRAGTAGMKPSAGFQSPLPATTRGKAEKQREEEEDDDASRDPLVSDGRREGVSVVRKAKTGRERVRPRARARCGAWAAAAAGRRWAGPVCWLRGKEMGERGPAACLGCAGRWREGE
jgi:hypothetical protein